MNRRIWALICLAVSSALQIHLYLKDEVHPFFVLVPFIVAWLAFMLPAMVPVFLIERYAFGFEPYDDGHARMTFLFMTVTATLIWFAPPYIARWFGTFDAVGDAGKRRLPSPVRGVAHALDFLNKRLFGRQKTGGWA